MEKYIVISTEVGNPFHALFNKSSLSISLLVRPKKLIQCEILKVFRTI